MYLRKGQTLYTLATSLSEGIIIIMIIIIIIIVIIMYDLSGPEKSYNNKCTIKEQIKVMQPFITKTRLFKYIENFTSKK